MNTRSRLRLGTLLWFALLGATIAITLHQQQVAGRISSLVNENRSLRAEADRLSATVTVLMHKLDEADLNERIAVAVADEHLSGLDLAKEGDRRWAKPFASWQLERLWQLSPKQSLRMTRALDQLALRLRAKGDIRIVTRAFKDFTGKLPSDLNDEQRTAISTWMEHVQSIASTDRVPAPEGDDASF